MINRWILWLSLAGMILALHLWVQKARGFDQGCLGFSKPLYVTSKDSCMEVSDLPASHLFRVSNAAWGYAFYLGLAVLSFVKIVVPPRSARRLHGVGEVGVLLAFLYSAYLVYEMAFVAGAFCVLCLISAGLVTVLFALHVWLRKAGGFQPVGDEARATEIGLGVGSLFAALGLLMAMLLFVNRLGTRPLDQGNTAQELEAMVGQSLPVYIDREKLIEMRSCRFDWWAPALDTKKLLSPDVPFVGAPDGLEVIAFYDPNCKHCRVYHAAFVEAMEKLKGRARFTILPRTLWEVSVRQVAALKLAERSGKYFELWQRMFDRQHELPAEMSVAELTAMFRDLGLDTNNLEARLKAVQPGLDAQNQRLRLADIGGLPAIFIGGKKVLWVNRSPECLGQLVDQLKTAQANAK